MHKRRPGSVGILPLIAVTACFCLPPDVFAQSTSWDEWIIQTDRNSVTPHPNAVPAGTIQFENGTSFAKFNRGGSIDAPETYVRLGIRRLTELRFSTPNFIDASGSVQQTGVSDISVGFKQEVEPAALRARGLDMGIIGGITIPTGSKQLTTKRVDPFVQLIAYQKVGQRWTFGTAHSLFMPSEYSQNTRFNESNLQHNITYQPTAIVYRAINSKVDIWAECAGNITARGSDEHIIDFGALWRPRKKQQLDIRAGFGLNSAAPRAFIGVGYSFIFGRLFGN